MSAAPLLLRKLAEKALAGGGQVPLALLLEGLVPLRELRALCREFGLSPKGFRIEKAPAHVLAPLLAELKDSQRLDRVLGLLVRDARAAAPAAAEDGAGDGEPPTDGPVAPDEGRAAAAAELMAERDGLRRDLGKAQAERDRLGQDLAKAEKGRTRATERESEQRQRAERLESEAQVLRAELARLRQRPDKPADQGPALEALDRQLRSLQQQLLGYEETDAALRRQQAVYQSRIRELEDDLKELEELVPKGKRRRKAQDALPPAPDKRVLVPHFADTFYRSLQDKDRKSVERAVHAILLFCSHGYGYPGLEVKQLMGQELWSLRAALGLRVYFRHLPDGHVEFLELGNREDQNTALRRWKERG